MERYLLTEKGTVCSALCEVIGPWEAALSGGDSDGAGAQAGLWVTQCASHTPLSSSETVLFFNLLLPRRLRERQALW